MRCVQFINETSRDNTIAAAVSAWSYRRRAGFSSDTEYILYTTNPSNYTDPLLTKVFDAVLPPPFNVDTVYNIDWSQRPCVRPGKQSGKIFRSTEIFWIKFLCFLETKCEGEPVTFSDFDTLCIDSMTASLPYHPFTWSGARWGGLYCNGGYLVKTPRFDASGGSAKMQEPLWDTEIYKKVYQLWKWDDEIGTAWYLSAYGKDDFYDLPDKFNRNVISARRNNEYGGIVDNRMIHFLGRSKPWLHDGSPLDEFEQMWFDCKDEMLKTLHIEE